MQLVAVCITGSEGPQIFQLEWLDLQLLWEDAALLITVQLFAPPEDEGICLERGLLSL